MLPDLWASTAVTRAHACSGPSRSAQRSSGGGKRARARGAAARGRAGGAGRQAVRAPPAEQRGILRLVPDDAHQAAELLHVQRLAPVARRACAG